MFQSQWSFLKLETQMVEEEREKNWYPMEWNPMKNVIGFQFWDYARTNTILDLQCTSNSVIISFKMQIYVCFKKFTNLTVGLYAFE